MDPRLAVIGRRLAGVARIVAVTGGKGGIGKSLVATTLSLAMQREGRRVGLLDLDFTGPCDHVFLGAACRLPEEKFGIVPAEEAGVRFLSLAFFTGSRPAALRGGELSDAVVELLAITQWGDVDVLVIDTPPGLGDALLDVLRLLPATRFLALSTPSRVVVETVRRTLALLAGVGAATLGVLENMRRGDDPAVERLAVEAGVRYLGAVPFDPGVEDAIGDPRALLDSEAGRAVRAVASGIS